MEEKKKKWGTREMVVSAVLAALVAILATLAVGSNAVKVTFESFPVHVAAHLMGPVVGIVVGCLGTFLYQMLIYGFTITTPLWILPYGVCGLIAGLYAKKNKFQLSRVQFFVITIICELVITGLNTLAIYIDSHIFGYYYPTLIIGNLALRLVLCVVKGMVYGLVLPPVVDRVRRGIGN